MSADATFNSALLYELGVFRPQVLPILEQVPERVPEYAEAKRLRKFLHYFRPVPGDQVPPTSFPAKLTRVLYERFTAGKPGLVILSCELIDNNGKELQKCVNQYIDDWKLSEDFRKWVNEENTFCSTLVDRIVPGRIRDPKEVERLNAANGYEDPLTDVGEVFGVWVIEGPDGLEDKLPFKKAGVNVMVVPDVTPYKKRKVRILNGAHTGFVLGAYLAGYDIVRDCMHDAAILEYMNHMLYDEVIPTLPLDKDDLKQFAAAVQDRFNNPFVNHELMSISLNSTSKWRARNMPTFLDYVKEKGELPKYLTTSFAMYIAFYSNDIQALTDKGLVCRRGAAPDSLNQPSAVGEADLETRRVSNLTKGNEYIDLHDCIHESSVPALIESMRKCGIKRFTYSSTWSSAVKIIWLFLHNGCTQEGMTEVHTSHIHDDPAEMAPAFIFDIH